MLPDVEVGTVDGVAVELQYVDKVVLRFYQWDKEGIPDGARAIPRKSKKERDAKHDRLVDTLGEDTGRKARGRIRENHTDTGDPFFNGVTGVTLPNLVAGLVEDGYRLVDFHVSEEQKPKKAKADKGSRKKGKTEFRTRYIPSFTFLHDGPALENEEALLAVLAGFTGKSYTLFAYDNIDNSVTLNHSGKDATRTASELMIAVGLFALKPVVTQEQAKALTACLLGNPVTPEVGAELERARQHYVAQ